MKKILLLLIAVASIAFADTAPAPTPAPTENEQLRQAFQVVKAQRDALATQILDTQAQLQIANHETEAIKKELADLKAATAPKPVSVPASAPAPDPKK